MNLLGEMENFLEKEHEEKVQKAVLEFSFEVRHFLNMYELTDENYVIYTHYGEEGRFLLTLFCVNPRKNLQECMSRGRGTVFRDVSAAFILSFLVQYAGRRLCHLCQFPISQGAFKSAGCQ